MTDVLTVKNLQVSYGGVEAVKGVDLVVPPRKSVAIIGANGAGKTSTLRAIGGQVRYQGDVHLNETHTKGKRAFDIARLGFAQVPQGRRLFPELTVRDNLALGSYSAKGDIAPLDEVFELFPRLAERHNQRAGSLSGGEQQMVAIGRSLMAKPSLIAMDEPSLGLAPILVSEIFEVIRQIGKRDIAILLVEQNAKKALEASDFVYVMERGEIVFSGPSATAADDFDLGAAYLSR